MCYGCMCPCRPHWLRRRRWRRCVGSGLSQWDGTLCISSDSNSFCERRKQMKPLRWLAIVYSLLIAGVIIAPVPSEAVGPPTLGILVDNLFGIPVPITVGVAGTCPMPAGYTNCYLIGFN